MIELFWKYIDHVIDTMDLDRWFHTLNAVQKTEMFNWYTTKDDLSTLAMRYQK